MFLVQETPEQALMQVYVTRSPCSPLLCNYDQFVVGWWATRKLFSHQVDIFYYGEYWSVAYDTVHIKCIKDSYHYHTAGAYDIVANTRLDSDVPLPYFSWAEYKFKTPVRKKVRGDLIYSI